MKKSSKVKGEYEMATGQRFFLITRNLQEIIGADELKSLLVEKKEVSVYWGTMPTGSPHVSYLYPLLKIADFLKAGLKVKILIADLHAALDGVSWEILDKRQAYYELLIPLMLQSVGVDTKKLEFVKGSKMQMKPEYFRDLLKLSTLTTVHDATRAASEVVKLGDNPKLGGILYPLMQALDEEYLGADIQFGGTDQRKIFVYAREYLPKIGYKSRVELMNYILPGLIGQKMSSSVPGSKIDMLESAEDVQKKINNSLCAEGDINNGLMAFCKYVLFVLKEDKKHPFVVERPVKFGGPITYKKYEDLEKDFSGRKLHPMDLKSAVAKEINAILEPLRENAKLRILYEEAYGKK
ncbi:MAG: tyrosine--tRNA ligase [Nanoarchaeota archaeon]|nr:tyrosine--tRNA ligase [Nanoarchaeota archaeon]